MYLRTLGTPGLEASSFKRPKLLLLLAYLALEGPQNRRHLAELFWAGAANHLKSLTVALAQLRKGVPGAVDASNDRVWSSIGCDAVDLLAWLEGGATRELPSRYPGPFMEDLHLSELGVELEEWLYETRERLAARVRTAAIELAEEAAAAGDYDESTDLVAFAAEISGGPEPSAEEAGRLHRLILANGGLPAHAWIWDERPAEQVSTPEEARRELRRERLANATPNNLSVRATGFIGRDDELEEISRLLSNASNRMISLIGPGGVGKTRLAQEAARRQLRLGRFTDGVYSLSLDAVHCTEAVAAGLAELLDVGLNPFENPYHQLGQHIAERRLLLLLDNFEHLLSGAGALADVVATCPNLCLLITSRERLNLEEERILILNGLPYPTVHGSSRTQPVPTSVPDALRFAAVRLFVDRAGRARPSFELNEGNLAHVLAVCEQLEGWPLAIELAASWVRSLAPEDIAAEVVGDPDLLETPTRNVPERQRSIGLVFDHSWNLLPDAERDLASRLAVFSCCGFDRQAAEIVSDATIPQLTALVDKSLLRVSEAGRYSYHPLLRSYLAGKLALQSAVASISRTRHAAHYLGGLAKLAQTHLFGARHKSALDIIESELENIRTAWTWVLDQKRFELIDAAVVVFVLQEFFDRKGRFSEGSDLFAQAEEVLSEQDPAAHELLGNVLVNRAYLQHRMGRHGAASETARRGMAYLSEVPESWGTVIGHYALGLIAWRTGEHSVAEHHLHCALRITESMHSPFGKAGVNSLLHSLAEVQQSRGDYGQAWNSFQAALRLSRSQNNAINIVRNLNALGDLSRVGGKLLEAREYLDEGLELANKLGFDDLIPQSLVRLSAQAFDSQEWPQAKELAAEALAMAEASGDRLLQARSLTILGQCAVALGEWREAHTYLPRALEDAWSVQGVPRILETLCGVGELWVREGNLESAAELFGAVAHHPAATSYDSRSALAQLELLDEQLPAPTVAAAVRRGGEMPLDQVVTTAAGRLRALP